VGINSLKQLRDGRIQIQTASKEEMETLTRDINDKCGDKVEAKAHEFRNPTMVIYNIPKTISTSNIEDNLIAQNPELNLKNGDITAKYLYETKRRTRNLVIEVNQQTRKLLTQKDQAWLANLQHCRRPRGKTVF
jgi:hypothetical protein